jgi:16S rRNA C967 or C1407 C5-methylase (RsmB/RsmF family)
MIILDAPCTSSGTLRKNPDLKLKIHRETIHRNRELQLRMLNSIRDHFPATTVLYSVCSFIRDETESLLQAFFNQAKPKTENIQKILKGLGFRCHQGEYGTYLMPTPALNNDIFYISLFRV